MNKIHTGDSSEILYPIFGLKTWLEDRIESQYMLLHDCAWLLGILTIVVPKTNGFRLLQRSLSCPRQLLPVGSMRLKITDTTDDLGLKKGMSPSKSEWKWRESTFLVHNPSFRFEERVEKQNNAACECFSIRWTLLQYGETRRTEIFYQTLLVQCAKVEEIKWWMNYFIHSWNFQWGWIVESDFFNASTQYKHFRQRK